MAFKPKLLQKTGQHGDAVANRAVSANGISLPAVPVLQNSIAKPALQTKSAKIINPNVPPIQGVFTNGGEFKTTTYKTVDAGGEGGADIKIEFTPNNLVPHSDKIGLTQTVETNRNHVPDLLPGLNTAVALGAGGPAPEGLAIDRDDMEGYVPANSPIYGANRPDNKTPMASKLTDHVPEAAEGNEFGYRKWFGANVPAKLYDSPRRDLDGSEITQNFETTALILEGKKKDTYLGSVKWGYKIDKGKKIALNPDPIALLSTGAPTDDFMAAAAKWNASNYKSAKQPNMKDLVDLPTTGIGAHITDFAAMTAKQKTARVKAIDVQIKAGGLTVSDRRTLKLEKKKLAE